MKYYSEYIGDNKYLLRLHNMNELKVETFVGYFSQLQEYTLTGNQLMSEWKEKQMKWSYEGQDYRKNKPQSQPEIKISGCQYTIDVAQQSIRTFIVSPM